MGMPAFLYRLAFGAFGVRAIERGVFRLAGMGPVRHTLLGGVETATDAVRAGWLAAGSITSGGWPPSRPDFTLSAGLRRLP